MEQKPNTKGVLKGCSLWGVLFFSILLLIDLITKELAQWYFTQPNAPQSIPIIPDWIELCITYNRGIAYGIGANSSKALKLGVIIGTGVIMLVLSIFYFRLDKRRDFTRASLVLIVAGGMGNLIDRIYYRVWDANTAVADPLVADGVRDMVDLTRFNLAVCNFADFCITIGAVLLVLSMLFFDKDALFPVGKYRKMAQEQKEKAQQEKNG